MKADYVLINYSPARFDGQLIGQVFHPEMIILGGNQKPYTVRTWTDSCKSYGIAIHATRNDGALVIGDRLSAGL